MEQFIDNIVNNIESRGHKLIFLTQVGSHLYGTNTLNSDRDYVGIFIPSDDYVLGLSRIEEIDLSIKDKDETGKNTENAVDVKVYELRKFLKLAMENNPNILEILFSNKLEYLTDEGKILVDNKKIFPYLGLYDKYMGYSISQRKKMVIKKSNYFDLHQFKGDLEKLFSISEDNKKLTLAELPYIKGFQVYRKNFKNENFIVGDLTFHKSRFLKKVYQMVVERLNKVGNRERLILKYGYDTKFSMHYHRLLYEGIRLLRTGELVFPLPEREELLKIRNGEYPIEYVLEKGIELEDEMRKAKETSELPKKSRFEKINELCKNLLKNNINKRMDNIATIKF
ncbi:conserved hypothetical protein (plasmid) [Deferribacter desulfuricans SSM1]|uniref:Nucleotidyltransferase n=1 Tax=Deferribacter desulfuricans (strain DSM 14783 / JCM 11476 / NBRC 101012 / SSM1) TaxID=639282 RepID=D3PEW2_DEFDS|nr:nucleotidyltransferase domain-containing protein [Deferribacter desulfuricans]BAI81754.1 conserved hypothetical protein [Deferribacter desulfuricans SSM1]